ncbi:MAG TPA: DUF1674 domain-containing protein [Stellaceae bacterium]|nr:DUF1674 domain-containing protein [Stellaceae bacterium]
MPKSSPVPAPAANSVGTVPSRPGKPADKSDQKPKEIGGPDGPEPTRYGDWERNGRCIDF